MANIRTAFVTAAQRSAAMGIEAVELHAAHGYLLHEFMSPIANQRTDSYGGSFENRIRFPLEVLSAVRQAFDGVLGVRISASDWVEGGWDLAQSSELALRLKAAGCDFIHVSSGGVSPQQKIALGAGYHPFAISSPPEAAGVLTFHVRVASPGGWTAALRALLEARHAGGCRAASSRRLTGRPWAWPCGCGAAMRLAVVPRVPSSCPAAAV
jgi:2,4-dienoyl-CoA reductase-like NADH-dependent reductase (Old Yellow Enzyme family)